MAALGGPRPLTGAYSLIATGNYGDVRGAELCAGLCAVYNYCDVSPNSVGPGARIEMAGSASISANAFTLIARSCPPKAFGLFFYNVNQIQQPFGDGWLCIGSGAPGIFRLVPPVRTNESGVAQRYVDFLLPPINSGPGAIHPASAWNFQFYFRDLTGPGGTGFNLTNALNVSFCL